MIKRNCSLRGLFLQATLITIGLNWGCGEKDQVDSQNAQLTSSENPSAVTTSMASPKSKRVIRPKGVRKAAELPIGSQFRLYHTYQLPAQTATIEMRSRRGFGMVWGVSCELQGQKGQISNQDQIISNQTEFKVTDVDSEYLASRRWGGEKLVTQIEATSDGGYNLTIYCYHIRYRSEPELDEVQAFLNFTHFPPPTIVP